MELEHPIDAQLRAWLKDHVPNHSQLSVAVGHSKSWLHKYVNGDGHATIDDLVRLAGLLMGLNLPVLTETELQLLKEVRGLEEPNQQDVLAYAKLRRRLVQPGASKESSAPKARKPPATTNKARGTR